MRACKSLVLMLAALSILCAALPVSAADTVTDATKTATGNQSEATGESSAENHLGWEWFGMKLGAPLLFRNDNKDRDMLYVHDIILPTYRWKWAYVTTGELTLQLAAFDAGITTGGGCRLPLGNDLDYELRIGTTLGYRYRIYESVSSVILSPQLQIIANFHRFSFGIGVDVPVFFNVSGDIDFFSNEPFIQNQVLLYLRFSVT